MRLSRPTRTALAVLAVALSATTTACGDAGGLRAAGATPTANSPARLWPDLPPASSPAFDFDEAETKTVKGVAVPGDDIRRVDPVAVVRAEITSDPGDYAGAGARYHGTVSALADCAEGRQRATWEQPKGCPVLQPYYRDLTGDGHDDLTLGFRLLPGELTAVRVYTVEKHRLVQVMSYEDALSAVELAGRSVIVRSPSEVAGYEYRLQWTWDAQQKAMLLTHDEMLRTGGRSPSPRHSSASRSAPPSSAAPSATPPASPSTTRSAALSPSTP
ncbi:hypothetical protein ACFV5G_02180 [Streptomyces sp. NPDC059766]|uniref:hypothetical protein n=1 Tax=Streptomyces sp. NPDC059766 TaxID=3346940 RepID=UPI0036622299